MDYLTKLIESLDSKDKKHFKDLALVKKTLGELKDFIGNDEIKTTVAKQIGYLIRMKEEGETKSIMLNTIIYGSPGVGKTRLGCILGAIYYGLGYLDEPKDSATTNLNLEEMQQNGYLSAFFLIVFLVTLMWTPMLFLYKTIGVWIFLIAFVIFTFVLYAIYMYQSSMNDTIKGKADNSAPTHTDIVNVVSREDFIGKYMGFSEDITRKLLNSSRGKVLLIDEAYSLYEGPYDQYGATAATIINKFMSEHPSEIIVIFTGYKDKLQEGLFKIQEGLPRRCMFHFEVPDYTPEDLFKIFSIQLAHNKYSLEDKDGVLQLFHENYAAFPGFGGDCERLVNFSITEYVTDLIDSSDSVNDKIISLAQTTRAIINLRKNNIHKNGSRKAENNGWSEIINNFRSPIST